MSFLTMFHTGDDNNNLNNFVIRHVYEDLERTEICSPNVYDISIYLIKKERPASSKMGP